MILYRLSIGLEDVEDIIEDIKGSLEGQRVQALLNGELGFHFTFYPSPIFLILVPRIENHPLPQGARA